MNLRFLPDEPIHNWLEDTLGFNDFAELIQRSIYQTKPPFVYGILGDWGTGKTSIMHLLMSGLQKELDNGAKPYIPIWFNAWHYENETNIMYPLLYAIKQSYESRVVTLDKARSFGRAFLRFASTSTLALTDVGLRAGTKALLGEAITLKDIRENLDLVEQHPEEIESVFRKWADQVAQLNSAFQSLLETYAADLAHQDTRLKPEDVRFVILIDDLDRCLPETTIALLENIKNYLTTINCIFIFGLKGFQAQNVENGTNIPPKSLPTVMIMGRLFVVRPAHFFLGEAACSGVRSGSASGRVRKTSSPGK